MARSRSYMCPQCPHRDVMTKPRCAVCTRPFHPSTRIPEDRVCRDCRDETAPRAEAPAPDFLPLDGLGGDTGP